MGENKVKKRKKVIVFLGIIVFLCAGFWQIQRTLADTPTGNSILEELKLFSKAINAIQYAYVEKRGARELFYEAVRGMLNSLDKYSQFIEPAKFEALQIGIKGEYGGIGVKLAQEDGFPVITMIVENSPADKAKLLIGDRFLAVDSVEIKGKNIAEISALIRGDIGSEVSLTVYRSSIDKTWEVVIEREKIEMQAVEDVRIVGEAIGYMKISDFQEHTAEQVDNALKDLKKKGMKALIIDIRNNDGGLLPQAVELAERFLPKGEKIVSVKSKVPEQRKEYVSSGTKTFNDYPLIVLVNQFSASASEIFSAAMQDHDRGVIIGTKTFGKASVQSVIPLDDKAGMKLTTARYVSPNGRMIDGIGIEPDLVVERGKGSRDNQVLKALELFKEYR